MEQNAAAITEKSYFTGDTEPVFPDVVSRAVGHMVRKVVPIPGYKAIVDQRNDNTFSIVSDRYKIVPHQELLKSLEDVVKQFPEFGEPTREIWTTNYGGKIRIKYKFPIEMEIKPGDAVNPTLEAFGSLDTSTIQQVLMGAFRLVCSNGMVVGKTLASYKRKHTLGISLDAIKHVLADGMANYSKATDLWLLYTKQEALKNEVFLYEELPFNKEEKSYVEAAIKDQGKVIQWNPEDDNEREVKINKFELYNIYTYTASHLVSDAIKRGKIEEAVAKVFN